MARTLLVTLTGTDNPYLRPRLPLEGMLELFEIGTHGRLISAVFRARLTDAEREAGPVKVPFGAPVEVKNPVFTYGASPAEADEDQQWRLDPDVDFAAMDQAVRRPDPLSLRSRDQTLSLTPRADKLVVSIEPDRPLDYGYEEAGLVLDADQAGRLRRWALSAIAVPPAEAGQDQALELAPTSSLDDEQDDDDDGYPSDAELDALAQFEGTPREFFAEVHRLWSYQDFVTEKAITGELGAPQIEVTLVTGGWSGNESVMEAIGRTMAHPLWWYMSQRGGLSVYRVHTAMYDTVFPLGLHAADNS